jgi:adenosylmethionine-8-amino-7-oxononanoate aminotransferase
MTSYWHPFADMGAVVASDELSIVRGDGAYVFDADDRRYFDATAGLWYCNVGHGRAEIAEAAARQLRTLAAYNNYGDLTTPATSELAERVAALAPVAGSKVFFCSGGSEAVDSAAKLARRYWHELGKPDKTVIVSRTSAYHGVNGFGTSIGGIPPNRDGFGPLLESAQVERDSAAALAETLDAIGPERVAAFFCEPVIGAGGVYPPPDGYLTDVQRICNERDVLFVVDEVITGFGRCGHWFASGRWGLQPDLLTCAKGITSGYLALGAVIASPRVAEPFFRGGVMWRHGYTYSGHAAACAAAHANLDIIERERLVERAVELEGELADALTPLADLEGVREVRAGTGVLAAVALEGDPARALAQLRRAGVLSRVLADGALQISPPFVTTRADLDRLSEAIAEVLEPVVGAQTEAGG